MLFNKNGIKTWMAPGDIPFGSTYTATINRAIKDSSCFVLLLSESAQGSRWVLNETERAVSTGKIIFTVLLDDVSMNDDFEFMLSTSQAVAIRKIDENDEEIKRLLKEIKGYTSEEKEELYETPDIDTCRYDISEQEPSQKSEPESRVNYVFINKTDGKSYPLNEDFYLFGRNAKKCNIVLQDSLSSLLHAVLTITSQGIYIKDLDTMNGTFVDGKLLHKDENRKLYEHSVIQIGNTEFIVEIEGRSDESEIERYKENVVLENDAMTTTIGLGNSIAEDQDDCCLDKDAVINGLEDIPLASEEAPQNIKKQSSQKASKIKRVNGFNNKPTKIYYFGPKRAAKMFQNIPDIIKLPEKTDIILSDAFYKVTGNKERLVEIESVILPNRVVEIKEGAFRQLIISKYINIPPSVKLIGEAAFTLTDDAYVDCEFESVAYKYCKEHRMRTSADMTLWHQYGRCQYCGGEISFFLRNCKLCGKHKDY